MKKVQATTTTANNYLQQRSRQKQQQFYTTIVTAATESSYRTSHHAATAFELASCCWGGGNTPRPSLSPHLQAPEIPSRRCMLVEEAQGRKRGRHPSRKPVERTAPKIPTRPKETDAERRQRVRISTDMGIKNKKTAVCLACLSPRHRRGGCPRNGPLALTYGVLLVCSPQHRLRGDRDRSELRVDAVSSSCGCESVRLSASTALTGG